MGLELGRLVVGEDTCGYEITGFKCMNKGIIHIMYEGDGENVLTCQDHYAFARVLAKVADEHPTVMDCTMPGTLWIYSDENGPGRCEFEEDEDVTVEVSEQIYEELLIGV